MYVCTMFQEKPTEAIVASASLSLRDLEDQAQHDKILPIKVRRSRVIHYCMGGATMRVDTVIYIVGSLL